MKYEVHPVLAVSAAALLTGTLTVTGPTATAEQVTGQSSEVHAAKHTLKQAGKQALKHYAHDLMTEAKRAPLKDKWIGDNLQVEAPYQEGQPYVAFFYNSASQAVEVYESARKQTDNTAAYNVVSLKLSLPERNVFTHQRPVDAAVIGTWLAHQNFTLSNITVETDARPTQQVVVFNPAHAPLYAEGVAGAPLSFTRATAPELQTTSQNLQHADQYLSANISV